MFGLGRGEMAGGWRKLRTDLRSFIIRTPPLDEIKEDEMIGASSACEES
jgi:hypothetical protein